MIQTLPNEAIFDHSLAAIIICLPDDSVLKANRVACELFGFSPAEFEGRRLGKLLDPGKSGQDQLFRDRVRNGSAVGELAFRHKNGSRIVCECSTVLFTDENGRELSSTLLIDITDRESSRQRLRNIIEHSTNMFYSHDPEGRLTYVSPQSVDFLGYDFEGIEPVWSDYLTDHPVNRIGEEYTLRALETGERQPPYELHLRKANGELIWVEVNEAPVTEQGRVVQIVGSLTDITDRKAAEEQSLQSRKLLAELTDQANAAVWVRTADGTHIIANREFHNLFRLEEPAVGKSLHELFDKPLAAQFRNNDARVLMTGSAVLIEEQVHTELGERYYRTSLFPLTGIPGHEQLVGGIAIDVTEQKAAEDLLRSALQEKNTLLAEIHHRVKNNLAVVSSLLEMQATGSESEELKSHFMKASLRINSMAAIHEQLYQTESFSRFRFSDGIRELIGRIVSTYQETTRLQMNFDLDPVELNINQAVPCSLLVNEVVTNILKHGYRDREAGQLTTTLKSDGDLVVLTIRDDGSPLPNGFPTPEPTSMGMVLIELLTRQLEGDTAFRNDEEGNHFVLTFEKRDKRGSSSHFVA